MGWRFVGSRPVSALADGVMGIAPMPKPRKKTKKRTKKKGTK